MTAKREVDITSYFILIFFRSFNLKIKNNDNVQVTSDTRSKGRYNFLCKYFLLFSIIDRRQIFDQ